MLILTNPAPRSQHNSLPGGAWQAVGIGRVVAATVPKRDTLGAEGLAEGVSASNRGQDTRDTMSRRRACACRYRLFWVH